MGKSSNIYDTTLVSLYPSWYVVSCYTNLASYMLLIFSMKLVKFEKAWLKTKARSALIHGLREYELELERAFSIKTGNK
jgi:hypothetical protein